jgi:hypothetical protein
MGSGDIGTNGSVHYTITHDDASSGKPIYKDHDPIRYDQIGRGTGGTPKDHPGYLAVRMRFPDAAAARIALDAAVASAGAVPGGNGVYVTCLVPAVTPQRMDPEADPFYEVRVDW